MSLDAARGRPTWPVVIAPLIVIVAIALLWTSNELITIGPFDRASFGWAVPVPMLLAAPAVAGLVGRRVDERIVAVAVIVTAVVLGLFVTGFLVAVIDRIGCDTSVDKIAILGRVAPVGLAAGIGYALAGGIASRLRDRPIAAVLTAISVAAASWLVALTLFAFAFQAASCAYVGS